MIEYMALQYNIFIRMNHKNQFSAAHAKVDISRTFFQSCNPCIKEKVGGGKEYPNTGDE